VKQDSGDHVIQFVCQGSGGGLLADGGGGGGQLLLRQQEQTQGFLKWRGGGRQPIGSQLNPDHSLLEEFRHRDGIAKVELP